MKKENALLAFLIAYFTFASQLPMLQYEVKAKCFIPYVSPLLPVCIMQQFEQPDTQIKAEGV